MGHNQRQSRWGWIVVTLPIFCAMWSGPVSVSYAQDASEQAALTEIVRYGELLRKDADVEMTRYSGQLSESEYAELRQAYSSSKTATIGSILAKASGLDISHVRLLLWNGQFKLTHSRAAKDVDSHFKQLTDEDSRQAGAAALIRGKLPARVVIRDNGDYVEHLEVLPDQTPKLFYKDDLTVGVRPDWGLFDLRLFDWESARESSFSPDVQTSPNGVLTFSTSSENGASHYQFSVEEGYAGLSAQLVDTEGMWLEEYLYTNAWSAESDVSMPNSVLHGVRDATSEKVTVTYERMTPWKRVQGEQLLEVNLPEQTYALIDQRQDAPVEPEIINLPSPTPTPPEFRWPHLVWWNALGLLILTLITGTIFRWKTKR